MREITEAEKEEIAERFSHTLHQMPRGKTYAPCDVFYEELTRRGFKIVKSDGKALREAFDAGAAYATGSHKDFEQTHPDFDKWVKPQRGLCVMDRQVMAVAEAIKRASNVNGLTTNENIAKAAIAASDASLVPGLVSALSDIAMRAWQLASGDYRACGHLAEEMGVAILHLVKAAIESLPPEYRNATQENSDVCNQAEI